MGIGYSAAVALLYRAPLEQFVAERKRLAQELKTAGEKEHAARLSKLPRPPLSAWAVNQLWWHERELFEQLLAAAQRLRTGDLGAGSAHREALAKLRTRAGALLTEQGHSAPDATLRRVAATLAALAASGGFEPEPPGALGADRDPPGFDTVALMPATALHEGAADSDSAASAAPAPDDELARRREQARAEAERREREAAEARRLAEERRKAEERAQRLAARHKLEAELAEARAGLQARSLERERLRAELARADAELGAAKSAVQELELRLARLDPYDRLS